MRITQSRRPRISRDGLLVLSEQSGGGLACLVSGCGNRHCDCRELLIHALPFDSRVREVAVKNGNLAFKWLASEDPTSSPVAEDSMNLRIDIDSGSLTDDEGAPVDVASSPRLAILEQAIDAKLLDEMANLWLREKRLKADGDTRLASPMLDDWRSGDMLAWYQVYQTLRADAYLLDRSSYLASDMYCVNPKCDCGRMTVRFSGERRDVGDVHLTLGSDKVKLEPTSGKSSLLQSLWEQYLRRHRGIGHLRQRDTAMKEFGAELHASFSPAPVNVRKNKSKIGRNAPCPCGSGKKYKKCCLGKK